MGRRRRWKFLIKKWEAGWLALVGVGEEMAWGERRLCRVRDDGDVVESGNFRAVWIGLVVVAQ